MAHHSPHFKRRTWNVGTPLGHFEDATKPNMAREAPPCLPPPLSSSLSSTDKPDTRKQASDDTRDNAGTSTHQHIKARTHEIGKEDRQPIGPKYSNKFVPGAFQRRRTGTRAARATSPALCLLPYAPCPAQEWNNYPFVRAPCYPPNNRVRVSTLDQKRAEHMLAAGQQVLSL